MVVKHQWKHYCNPLMLKLNKKCSYVIRLRHDRIFVFSHDH